MEKSLLDLSREVHAIAKSGLAFSKDPFDIERFHQLEEIAAGLISKHSSHSKEYLQKVFSAESGYVTPKLDVRAAAFKNGKILMVKERESASWTLPGGYVDVNESLSEAVAREASEESGLSVKPIKIAAVFDHRKGGYKPHLYHFYKIYMICDLIGGHEKPSVETSEIKFFSRDEIEKIQLDPGRITRAHILRMFDHADNLSLPTDFD